jgi:hypothetical protein
VAVFDVARGREEGREECEELVEDQLLRPVEENTQPRVLHLGRVHNLLHHLDDGPSIAVGQGEFVLLILRKVFYDHILGLSQHEVDPFRGAVVLHFIPEREESPSTRKRERKR